MNEDMQIRLKSIATFFGVFSIHFHLLEKRFYKGLGKLTKMQSDVCSWTAPVFIFKFPTQILD